jgi:methenyltetrahydrofolate cyclohydrolase
MTGTLQDQTMAEFLNALASSAPTPGGGSVAAFNGAIAAGLISMVGSITLGKKKPPENKETVESIHAQAEELRQQLQALAQADVEVFNHLSAAYKLPRTTDADAAARKEAIQKITREAAEVPLKTARAAAAVLPLCSAMVESCSRLLVSDIGVAAILARATVQSSLLNVEINLATLEDAIFVRETRAHMEDLSVGLDEEASSILEVVRNRINS